MLGLIVLCKTGDKLGIILHLERQESKHMKVCYMNENSCIKIFHAVSEHYRDFHEVDSCYKHLVTSLPNLGEAIVTTGLDLVLGRVGGGACKEDVDRHLYFKI